jgi:hypothetical protein
VTDRAELRRLLLDIDRAELARSQLQTLVTAADATMARVSGATNVVTGRPTISSRRYPIIVKACDPALNDPATLAYIVGYRNQHETFKVQETGFNFNGPVFELPGGPLQFAIAGQTLREHWTYQNLQNDNTDSTAIITNGIDSAWQYSYAFFGQADIPIFGANNAVPFIQSLVVELDEQLRQRPGRRATVDAQGWGRKREA